MRWISKKHKELARKVKTSNAECGDPWARLLMNYSVRLGNKIPFSQKVNQSPVIIQLTKTLLEALWKRCRMPPAFLGLPQRGRGYRASTQISQRKHTESWTWGHSGHADPREFEKRGFGSMWSCAPKASLRNIRTESFRMSRINKQMQAGKWDKQNTLEGKVRLGTSVKKKGQGILRKNCP